MKKYEYVNVHMGGFFDAEQEEGFFGETEE